MARKNGRGGSRQSQPPPAAPPTPRWHWWRSGEGARSRAEEELNDLSAIEKAELLAVIRRIRDGEHRGQDLKSLGGKILEGRARTGEAFLRVAFFRWGNDFVGLTVFKKKKNQTEPQDLSRAQDRRTAWLAAFGNTPNS